MATWLLHSFFEVEVTELFEDPVALAGLPTYVGLFTYLSASLLIVSGSILIFAAWSAPQVCSPIRVYVILVGGLVLWLGLDDVFMVHEWVGLRLAWLRGSADAGYDRQWLESYVFAAYAIAWMTVLIMYRHRVARTAWILLTFALLCFGVSIALDLLSFLPLVPKPDTQPERVFIAVVEDLGKLAGSMFMLAYGIHTSRELVRGTLRPLMPEGPSQIIA